MLFRSGAIDSIFIGKKEIAVVTFIQHSSRGQRIEFEITENGISRKYSNYVLSGFSIKTGDKITVFRGRFDALIERIAVQVILLFSFVNTTIVITLIALIKLIKKFNK